MCCSSSLSFCVKVNSVRREVTFIFCSVHSKISSSTNKCIKSSSNNIISPTQATRGCAHSMHVQFWQGNYMRKPAYRWRANIRMVCSGDACYVVAAFIRMAQYDVLNCSYHIGLFLTKTGIHDVFMYICAYITHKYTHIHFILHRPIHWSLMV